MSATTLTTCTDITVAELLIFKTNTTHINTVCHESYTDAKISYQITVAHELHLVSPTSSAHGFSLGKSCALRTLLYSVSCLYADSFLLPLLRSDCTHILIWFL